MTHNKGSLTVGATEAVGAAAAGAAGDDGGDVLVECFIPPTTPPTIAATMTTARRIMKIIQKVRLRRPHILRGLGSGGRGISSSIILTFAGVIGVSGTTVVPPMPEIIVEAIAESIVPDSVEDGDS